MNQNHLQSIIETMNRNYQMFIDRLLAAQQFGNTCAAVQIELIKTVKSSAVKFDRRIKL